MLQIKFTFFLLFGFATAMAQQGYWQQQVNYTIAVTLNDTEHTLDGFVKMDYLNNSPDTLTYIWIHLWPNAYKNDRTAYTDQSLENGNTAFYFSNIDQRGYINRLDFRVNSTVVKTEDHPEHQDITKIVLPYPLVPGGHCKIETPFHVKLPDNFSRGGHNGQTYQITQWYPKPAVYDSQGWHPMPYLDQGEFYSEFGNYEVQINVPSNYIIAATGELQSEKVQAVEADKLITTVATKKQSRHKPFFPKKKPVENVIIPSQTSFKTLVYTQKNVHDFAWFADKRYQVQQDTLLLASGRIIKLFAYGIKNKPNYVYWKNALAYIKKAVLTRSNLLGEYPYNTVSVADADIAYAGGMEYPTIALISGVESTEDLEGLIEHEVGHNWFYGILASNERQYPWMDEGMNTYYGTRYWNKEKYINIRKKNTALFINKRMPGNLGVFNMENSIEAKQDQPINTSSEKLSVNNYDIIAYHKAGRWMKMLETQVGARTFDSCMKEYYSRWKFKHPSPADFKNVLQEVSGNSLDTIFSLQNKRGSLTNEAVKRPFKFASFFSFKDTDKYKYIFISPAVGYNMYDKMMIGILFHNYTLPAEKFQFIAAPMYATGSSTINGLARVGYHWQPNKYFKKIELGIGGARFSSKQSLDTTLGKVFENFYKIVPSLRAYFIHRPRSTQSSWIDFRTYFIGEKTFTDFGIIAVDSENVYPRSFVKSNRYINQLSFVPVRLPGAIAAGRRVLQGKCYRELFF
jgi:Peptidase family M1 domain